MGLNLVGWGSISWQGIDEISWLNFFLGEEGQELQMLQSASVCKRDLVCTVFLYLCVPTCQDLNLLMGGGGRGRDFYFYSARPLCIFILCQMTATVTSQCTHSVCCSQYMCIL